MQNVLLPGELNRYLAVLISRMQNVSFPPSDTIRMVFCFLTINVFTRKQNVFVISADTKNKYYLVSIFITMHLSDFVICFLEKTNLQDEIFASNAE